MTDFQPQPVSGIGPLPNWPGLNFTPQPGATLQNPFGKPPSGMPVNNNQVSAPWMKFLEQIKQMLMGQQAPTPYTGAPNHPAGQTPPPHAPGGPQPAQPMGKPLNTLAAQLKSATIPK